MTDTIRTINKIERDSEDDHIRHIHHTTGTIRRTAITGCAGKQGKGVLLELDTEKKYIQQVVAESIAKNGILTLFNIVGDIIYPEGLKKGDTAKHMVTVFQFLHWVYAGAGIVTPTNTVGGNHESNMRSFLGAKTKGQAHKKLESFVDAINTLQKNPLIQKLTKLAERVYQLQINHAPESGEALQALKSFILKLYNIEKPKDKHTLYSVFTEQHVEALDTELDDLLSQYPESAGISGSTAFYQMYNMPKDYYCDFCYDENGELIAVDFYLDSSHYPTDRETQRQWFEAVREKVPAGIPINIYTHHTAYFTTGRRAIAAHETSKTYTNSSKEGNQHKAFGTALAKDGAYANDNAVRLFAAHEHTAHVQNIAEVLLSDELKAQLPGLQVVSGTGGANSNKTDFKSFPPGLALLCGGYGYTITEQKDDGSMVLTYYDTSRLDGEIGNIVARYHYDKNLKLTHTEPENLKDDLSQFIAPALFKEHKRFFLNIQQAFVSGDLSVLNLYLMLHSDAASDMELGRRILPQHAWEHFLLSSCDNKSNYTIEDLKRYQIALEQLCAYYLRAHASRHTSELFALISMIYDARKLMEKTADLTFKDAANLVVSKIEKAVISPNKDITSVNTSVNARKSQSAELEYDADSDDEFDDKVEAAQENLRVRTTSEQRPSTYRRKTLAFSPQLTDNKDLINAENFSRIVSEVGIKTFLASMLHGRHNITGNQLVEALISNSEYGTILAALVLAENFIRKKIAPATAFYHAMLETLKKASAFTNGFLAYLYDHTDSWLTGIQSIHKTRLQALFDEYHHTIKKIFTEGQDARAKKATKAKAMLEFLYEKANESNAEQVALLFRGKNLSSIVELSGNVILRQYFNVQDPELWSENTVRRLGSSFNKLEGLARNRLTLTVLHRLKQHHYITKTEASSLIGGLYDILYSLAGEIDFLIVRKALNNFINTHLVTRRFVKRNTESHAQLKKRYRDNGFLRAFLSFIYMIQDRPDPEKGISWQNWLKLICNQLRAQKLVDIKNAQEIEPVVINRPAALSALSAPLLLGTNDAAYASPTRA